MISESPNCRTNVSQPNNEVDVTDFIEITCSLRHSGTWTPVIICASGLPGGPSSHNQTSPGMVSYRRVIAARDIFTDETVLNCTLTFRLDPTVQGSGPAVPANADIPDFKFVWNTPTIRIVNATGEHIVNIVNIVIIKVKG